MGGFRSSRWSNGYERALTVQECYCIKASFFKNRLHNRNGFEGYCPIQKQYPYECIKARCELILPYFQNPAAKILFEYPFCDEPPIQVHQNLQFNSTRPIVGGERWWFICPECGVIRSHLYVVPGEEHFVCREDGGLVYASNLKTHTRQSINGYFANR